MLSQLHRRCLEELLGDDLTVHELDRGAVSGARSVFRALRGYIDGVSPAVQDRIVRIAREQGVSRIFLDGSNLGRLAKIAKKHLPEVEVLTFFHNVEARFFLGALRESRNVHALAVLFANFVAERMAVRCSGRRITLSERDSRLLARLYGRAGTDILAMAVEDKLPPDWAEATPAAQEGYALFLGGAFYANQAGIAWFAEKVAPHVDIKTYVIGRGMEALRDRIERSGKVEVVGAVEQLGDWYLNAHVVIAPIFDGSGMKTKTAEALMFGKKIVGTAEAFSGYEAIAGLAGWLCDSPEQFIAALREAQSIPLKRFDPKLRRLYERLYSRPAARRNLGEILGTPPFAAI